MGEKTASVWGPDPHVLYSTAQPKANCDDTSHPTHHTYCPLLLGTTCVQCLYTVVYRSSQVDRIYISITMGKVDGCRLWSPRLTGGRVYPYYQCSHRELINVSTIRSTCPSLLFKSTPDCGSNSTAKQSNKLKSWIDILFLFNLSYDMSIRTCTINSYHGSNHSILHTRIPSQRKSIATVPHCMFVEVSTTQLVQCRARLDAACAISLAVGCTSTR